MFNKKKKDPVRVILKEDQFCSVIQEKASDVTKKYCVIADASNYTLLYRDGQYLGIPCLFGGPIYPFSIDPREPGSNGDKKSFVDAKIVTLSKDFNLKVNWGTTTRFNVEDPVTHKIYSIGAGGIFYVNIDPTDAAKKADMFYNKCLTQRNADLFNTEALCNFLREAFLLRVEAIIVDYINEKGRELNEYIALTPSDMLKVSTEIYPKLSEIFASYGLSMVKLSSEGSILTRLDIKAV